MSVAVLASVLVVSLLHFLGRFVYLKGVAGPGEAELFTLAALLLLGAVTFLALRNIYELPMIGMTFLIGMFVIILVEGSRVLDAFLYGNMFMSSHGAFLSSMREGVFALGASLFMASFYLCLLETARTKDELRRLNTELETRVRERTAELSQANELLYAEIEERLHADRLIADQQLKMINAARMSALGLMAGGIAHEINNPLAIIAVGAQQLESLLRDPTPDLDRVFKVSDTISRNVTRIHRIVRALRSLTREGIGDPFTATSLKEILADSLELCQERFKRHGITLVVADVPADVEIECRASQLSQVILNLLNNACDAVETSEDKWISLSFASENGDVVLSVANGGPRLGTDVEDKVFIPFFTTKTEGKGIGLGLSISKTIIDDHKGTLELDPDFPHTRFVIRVPRQQMSMHEQEGGEPSA